MLVSAAVMAGPASAQQAMTLAPVQIGGEAPHNGNLTLDPIFLKSVTVEAGVAPVDAGFGALGGAVRFATKDACDMLLPSQTVGGTAILGILNNAQGRLLNTTRATRTTATVGDQTTRPTCSTRRSTCTSTATGWNGPWRTT